MNSRICVVQKTVRKRFPGATDPAVLVNRYWFRVDPSRRHFAITGRSKPSAVRPGSRGWHFNTAILLEKTSRRRPAGQNITHKGAQNTLVYRWAGVEDAGPALNQRALQKHRIWQMVEVAAYQSKTDADWRARGQAGQGVFRSRMGDKCQSR